MEHIIKKIVFIMSACIGIAYNRCNGSPVTLTVNTASPKWAIEGTKKSWSITSPKPINSDISFDFELPESLGDQHTLIFSLYDPLDQKKNPINIKLSFTHDKITANETVWTIVRWRSDSPFIHKIGLLKDSKGAVQKKVSLTLSAKGELSITSLPDNTFQLYTEVNKPEALNLNTQGILVAPNNYATPKNFYACTVGTYTKSRINSSQGIIKDEYGATKKDTKVIQCKSLPNSIDKFKVTKKLLIGKLNPAIVKGITTMAGMGSAAQVADCSINAQNNAMAQLNSDNPMCTYYGFGSEDDARMENDYWQPSAAAEVSCKLNVDRWTRTDAASSFLNFFGADIPMKSGPPPTYITPAANCDAETQRRACFHNVFLNVQKLESKSKFNKYSSDPLLKKEQDSLKRCDSGEAYVFCKETDATKPQSMWPYKKDAAMTDVNGKVMTFKDPDTGIEYPIPKQFSFLSKNNSWEMQEKICRLRGREKQTEICNGKETEVLKQSCLNSIRDDFYVPSYAMCQEKKNLDIADPVGCKVKNKTVTCQPLAPGLNSFEEKVYSCDAKGELEQACGNTGFKRARILKCQ